MIVDDRNPKAETVRSIVCMMDFEDEGYPFPDRGITTKGYTTFENCHETSGP
jgi:hypothetical protein